jgi:integrase
MAIRKRKGRASPYQVYWNNPFSGKRESASFATLADARREDSLIQHRLKHERESFKPEDEEQGCASGTVREIIALYLSSSKMNASNLSDTLYHLKSLLSFMGKKEIASLTKKDILLYMQFENQAGRKTLTAHRRVSILRAALSWARDNEYIDMNPLAGIKIPKGRSERIAPPSLAEAESLMAVAPNHLRRAILLSVYLGVRVGESKLLSMRWKDFDIKRGIVRVWSADKNPDKPYRDVPMREDLLAAVKQWQQEDEALNPEMVVHFRGRAIGSIKTAWKTCKRNAGITRRLRPYDLRHAFATYALDGGADINAVADNMGHSDPTMILKHYQHVKEAMRRAAVESISALPEYVPSKCAQRKKDLQQ